MKLMTSCGLFLLALSLELPSAHAEESRSAHLGTAVPIADPSGHALDQLHLALRKAKAGEGRARLAFYGDSHTAQDQYTGFLRSRLQQRFGDGGPGFVFPVEHFPLQEHRAVITNQGGPWKVLRVKGGHRPRDLYGLAGVAAQTTRRSWTSIELRHGQDPVDRFDVYYQKQPGGGHFDAMIAGTKALRISTIAKRRETGFDVISRQGRRIELCPVGNGLVRLFGVSLERGETGVIVDSLGIPGAKARDQLAWNVDSHRLQLARSAPDLIVLEYGTNESGGDLQSMMRYERDLRAVIGRLRRVRPEASCLLMGPTDWPERGPGQTFRPRKRTTSINEVQRRVAGSVGCGFFDTLAFMGGAGVMPRWVGHSPPLAFTDHVHLTDDGHRRLASALETALLANLSD